MTEDLEQFYTTLQDIDQWLDQAIEKSRDLQTSKDNIHNQFNDYKVLILAVLYYTPQFSMGTHQNLCCSFKYTILVFLFSYKVYFLIQEFVEEIQVKELEIAGVIKMADDFRDTAQVKENFSLQHTSTQIQLAFSYHNSIVYVIVNKMMVQHLVFYNL